MIDSVGFGEVFSASRTDFLAWSPPLWGPIGEATAAATRLAERGATELLADSLVGIGVRGPVGS